MLDAEFPGFISQCREAYSRLCPTDGNIVPSVELNNYLFSLSTTQLYETDLCSELHVGEHAAGILAEEAHRFAGFELMFHIGVGATADLHHQLVEAVVVGAPYRQGKPAHATAHFLLHAHVLCLPLELLLLELVFL